MAVTASNPAPALRQRRCSNHPQREASARCPECTRFFCRECITEHDDRVLCASCLAKVTRKKEAARGNWAWLARAGLALLAVGVAYLAFFLLGQMLLAIPQSFHDRGGW